MEWDDWNCFLFVTEKCCLLALIHDSMPKDVREKEAHLCLFQFLVKGLLSFGFNTQLNERQTASLRCH